MNAITGKYRVSDKVLDDAVHRLALMCVESSLKETRIDPVDLPNLAADQYCIASEMIRKRINIQRLTDGTNPDGLCQEDPTKVWFGTPVTETVFYRHERISRP